MTLARRSFLSGLTGFIACSPAIVRASSLMPVKQMMKPAVLRTSFAQTEEIVGINALSRGHGLNVGDVVTMNHDGSLWVISSTHSSGYGARPLPKAA